MKLNILKMSAFTVLLVSFMLHSPARAAESGFYVEFDIGRSNVTDNSVSLDENATGFRLATGYHIVRWLAVDLAYVDFGTFETSFIDIIGPPIQIEASADGLELGLVGRVPIGDKFALTASFHRLWWDSKVVAGGMQETDSGNDNAYGLGMELALNKRYVVTGGWKKMDVSNTNVDLVTLGLRIRFGGTGSE